MTKTTYQRMKTITNNNMAVHDPQIHIKGVNRSTYRGCKDAKDERAMNKKLASTLVSRKMTPAERKKYGI